MNFNLQVRHSYNIQKKRYEKIERHDGRHSMMREVTSSTLAIKRGTDNQPLTPSQQNGCQMTVHNALQCVDTYRYRTAGYAHKSNSYHYRFLDQEKDQRKVVTELGGKKQGGKKELRVKE